MLKSSLRKQIVNTLFLLLVIIFYTSCKRENLLTPKYGSSSINHNAENVTPQELTKYLIKNIPNAYLPHLHLNQATQKNFGKYNLIRINIAPDAALFVTKENGLVKGWIYKWNSNKQKKSTQIFDYSLNENKISLLSYEGRHLSKKVLLNEKSSDSSPGKGTKSIGTFLAKIACWITGGRWDKGDGSPGNYGANGEVGVAGCDYSSSNDEDSDEEVDPNGPGGIGEYIIPGVYFGPEAYTNIRGKFMDRI